MNWRLVASLLLCGLAGVVTWLAGDLRPAQHEVQTLTQAWQVAGDGSAPPPRDAPWQAVQLPTSQRGTPALRPTPLWFRMPFNDAGHHDGFLAVLLPYLYGGGQVWVNGQRVGDIPVSTPQTHVRWERPHLVMVPDTLLRTQGNELWVHAVPVQGETVLNVPAPSVGAPDSLRQWHDRRFFWVQTVPELCVGGCLVVAILVLLIWVRLPEEVLYGWFGVATLLWGLRTLTFVAESLPQDRWPWWRLIYLVTTGGFVVVMALFVARSAGLRRPWLERGLLAYWLSGPVWLLLTGVDADALVNRVWTAGLIPVGVGMVSVALYNTWKLRTLESLALPLALALATLCGIHDYLVVWNPAVLAMLNAEWAGQRYFLLHHGANVLLVTMGLLLSSRFVRSVREVRVLNETLESRIADRERVIAANFDRMADLERRQAAAEERKLIMREIHDGLGSRLFTSLSRVERGAMDGAQIADLLRQCIADMRLALDVLSPEDQDLCVAFGDFMFRWQAELQAVGINCDWRLDVPGEELPLKPYATLQLLRVAREALTNVVKHAQARQVWLLLTQREDRLCLQIEDDGVGLNASGRSAGRGLGNMATRAQDLGGTLRIEPRAGGGTQVSMSIALSPFLSSPRESPPADG